MKRVIISGATGTIGIALIEELLKHGIEVLILCRKGSVREKAISDHPKLYKIYASLEDYADLKNETGKSFDVFYHFAWDGTIGNTRNDVSLQYRNIKYTLDAVNLAKRFGCKKFVGAGSQAEYGRVEGKLTAMTPAFPENCYGMAKLCAGQMSRLYSEQLGLEHVWVRILSIYGPNDGIQTMVMSTINKLKNGEKAKFTKGEQFWDYLYSGDAAEAFRLIGETGKNGKIYVLGSGKARPLSEYIKIIGDKLNARQLIELGVIPYSEKQVMYLCADTIELQKDTGWRAMTTFEQGIANIIKQ